MREIGTKALLDWYDVHARDLPWRVGPAARRQGERPDPYRVWLSEVMLQQTTVAAVGGYYRDFTGRWPDVHSLAAAPDSDVMAAWAGLGYYARARNLLASARIVSNELGGVFPETRSALMTLPGIGPYTAAAISAIAFDAPETVVDGNVERVVARLFAVTEPLPGVKKRLAALAGDLTPQERPGDYAQAMMDLGATICTPRGPDCRRCPLRSLCQAHAQGIAAELPRRGAKKPKPVRRGIAYLARRSDGAWLVETRPPRGLLGGMTGWPGSDWTETAPAEDPPLVAAWHDPGAEVRHTFTHFHLRLSLRLAKVPPAARPRRGTFVGRDDFAPSALPTVMRKAYDLARGWPGWN